MKIRSRVITNTDQQVLADLRADYIMLGFETRLDPGKLTVYAKRHKSELTKNREKKKKDEKRPKRFDRSE